MLDPKLAWYPEGRTARVWTRTFGLMNTQELCRELKRLIVSELNLKGRSPDTIEDDAPLFGAGLGLDSLDALQLAMVIEEKLGVRIPEGAEARAIFASVMSIANYIAKVHSV